MTTFRTPRHRLTWLIAALVTTLVAVTVGIVNGTYAFAISTVSFTGSPQTAGATATWTVGFTTANGNAGALGPGDTITVKFNPSFTAPASPNVSLVSGFTATCTATSSSWNASKVFTITLAGSGCAHAKGDPASISVSGIGNPTLAASYAGNTFSVATSNEPAASPAAVVIAPGSAAQLAFTQQPAGAVSGTAFTTQPKVTVQDAFGNTVTTDNSVVTLAITSGTPSTGGPGALTGCTSVRAAGVSTFSGCKINTAGTGYRLHAVDGALTAADSAVFTVTFGPATQLAFTTPPPATGTAGSALSTFQVSIQDATGDTVTSATDTVTLTIISGPAGGTFNSPPATYTNVAAVGGVATFSGIVFNTPGNYTLRASDTTAGHTGYTTATSGAIAISAGAASRLVFVQQPSSVAAGAVVAPAVTVQLQDSVGNAVSTAGIGVTLAVSAGVIDAGASATTNASGLATFSGVVINTAAVGLTLTASASGLTSTPASVAFNVTVAVSNGAALTDAVNDGSGSGVKTVSYFYCAGYTGACTSANWTLIGSSTTAVGNYVVTWSGQPANGPYRLVVVGTDNVNNVSQPSASIPVTVTN